MSDRNTELQLILKRDGGVIQMCKRICQEGPRGGITEHELCALITEYAQQLYPDMSPEGAFSKLFTSPGGESLRRATQIVKGLMSIEPVRVDASGVDDDDAAKAYEALQRLATLQRKRAPSLSASQAFERAGRDRPDLLNRATGSPYQLPRR
jgi:hypothetical protein